MKKNDYFQQIIGRIHNLDERLHVLSYGKVVHIHEYPLYCVKKFEKSLPNVFISAGNHGDEPAGIYALLQFLEDSIFEYLVLTFLLLSVSIQLVLNKRQDIIILERILIGKHIIDLNFLKDYISGSFYHNWLWDMSLG